MLKCSFLFIIQEIIIFMTYCKLVIGNYNGLYLACIMQAYGCPLLYGAFLGTKCYSSVQKLRSLPRSWQPSSGLPFAFEVDFAKRLLVGSHDQLF